MSDAQRSSWPSAGSLRWPVRGGHGVLARLALAGGRCEPIAHGRRRGGTSALASSIPAGRTRTARVDVRYHLRRRRCRVFDESIGVQENESHVVYVNDTPAYLSDYRTPAPYRRAYQASQSSTTEGMSRAIGGSERRGATVGRHGRFSPPATAERDVVHIRAWMARAMEVKDSRCAKGARCRQRSGGAQSRRCHRRVRRGLRALP